MITNSDLDAVSAAIKKSFYEGVRGGVSRWAWWKDGIQYVGSCGTTLAQALADIDREEREP